MKNLFKNLLPYKWIAVLVLLLLFGQAFCDMALPQYTQRMIDTGIQNRGVEHILPEKMQIEEYFALAEVMDEEQLELLNSAYLIEYRTETDGDAELASGDSATTDGDAELATGASAPTTGASNGDAELASGASTPTTGASEGAALKSDSLGDYALRDDSLTEEQLAKLDKKLLEPVLARYLQTLDETKAKEARQTIEAEKESSLAEGEKFYNNETLLSMGYTYAANCDEAAGIDVDAIQNAYMWKCGGMMALMALLMLACTICVSFLSARIGANIGRDLRSKMFRNVMSFSTYEMDQFHTSSLITRATNDIQQVQQTCTMLMRMMLYSPCICIWGIVMVYRTHAHMNFIIVFGTLFLLALIGVVLKVAMPKFKIMQSLVDALNSVSREILTGIQVIRAFGREKTEEERFNVANTNLYDVQLFINRTMTLLSPIMMIVMYGLTIWITWTGAHRIDSGVIQVGAMTAFISYAMMIVTSFLMIAGMFLFLPRAGVAADRVTEVIETKASIVDAENTVELPEDIKGLVKFDHVSFMYPDAEENVLTDMDFVCKPGETTAIIGSTGCGKSTLIDLIPRFYDVTEGAISIDGIDIREVQLEALREKIGYVPQKGILFTGTIDSNIKFGKPDASAEDVAWAAEVAQASDFIEEKDEKLESYIAQGGSNVSGGQRQRLSIARALAKKPKILIFDDSFSALDMKTDAKLRKALAEQAGAVTKIVVAQRVGTILNAEQIIVLEDGHIAGKGTHEELMKNCAVYREIAESQLSEEDLKNIDGR